MNRKYYQGEAMLKLYIMVALSVTATLAGQILLKKGITQVGAVQLGDLHLLFNYFGALLTNLFALGGMACAVSGVLIWLVVLSKADLSFLFPLSGAFFYILLLVCSQFILKEQVGPMRWFGVIVIVVGIFIISRK